MAEPYIIKMPQLSDTMSEGVIVRIVGWAERSVPIRDGDTPGWARAALPILRT